jgi:hypothetical protein
MAARDVESKRMSCLDQFDRQSDRPPERDNWIESFFARLRALMHRIRSKK